MSRAHCLIATCVLAMLWCFGLAPATAQAAEKLGVVVLHGKNGAPEKNVGEVVRVLRNVGMLVSAPEMPWSRRRGFDVSYQQALVEIGIAVEDLHVQGATHVALVGYSLGANAALAYTATRGGVFALVALAPSHDPERHRDVFYADVYKAKQMLVSGRGRERSLFVDINLDKDYDLSTSAEVYLSYNDPDGAAVMPHAASMINLPLPILWVLGLNDPLTRLGRFYAFEKAPRHPKSRYEEIFADHQTVPAAAAPLVAEWLRALVEELPAASAASAAPAP